MTDQRDDGVSLVELSAAYDAGLITTPGPAIVTVMAYVEALRAKLAEAENTTILRDQIDDLMGQVSRLGALCAQRESRIAELEALNAERNRQNAAAFADIDIMRAKLLELAGECEECGGRGFTSAPDPSDGSWHDQPCEDCADIREAARATAQQPAEGA